VEVESLAHDGWVRRFELADTSAVELSAVSKSFGTETVLSGIDLRVGRGEFVSLVGPSGCGKSTLLRLAAGLERPTHGVVKVAGEPLTGRASSLRPAFVFQDPALLPWRSVWRNVTLPLELSREAIDKPMVLEQLRQVGLSDADTRKLPRQLSGGMRMRVSLARALVTRPQLLLMDEPFAALDDLLRSELADRLSFSCSERGITVLFVTHNVAEAVRLSDRIVLMGRGPGRILEEFSVPFDKPRTERLTEDSRYHERVAALQRRLREVLR